ARAAPQGRGRPLPRALPLPDDGDLDAEREEPAPRGRAPDARLSRRRFRRPAVRGPGPARDGPEAGARGAPLAALSSLIRDPNARVVRREVLRVAGYQERALGLRGRPHDR